MNYNGFEANPKALGPWGGQHGIRWDDGIHSGVKQVIISSSSVGIHSIQFEYDKNGRSVWSDAHGGNSGTRTDQIKLDYPAQVLVSISGHYGSITERGPMIVLSITLETNRKRYGPFGIERGTPFAVPVSGERVVGFHGWSSKYLDSIGVYVKPHLQTKQLEPHGPYQMVPAIPTNIAPAAGKKVLSLGPWGGDGGTTFDDGIYTGVREVHITRSGGLVSIRVCYDQNGKTVWGSKHGGSGGLKLDKVVFDYPFEVLTHITGHYGSTVLRGPTIVKSITFNTNKRSYGPFGDPQGFPFSSGSTGGNAIVGFHGKNGYFVNSIGVHVLDSKPVVPRSYPDPYDMASRPSQPYRDPYEPVSYDNFQPYRDPYDRPNHEISQPYRDPYGLAGLNDSLPYPDPYNPTGTKPSEVVWGVPRQPAGFNETGPWGGDGGLPWDDGMFSGVKKIILTRGDVICSVQIQYDQHGHSVWASPHGVANNACTYHIKFDYPYEVLTSISGYYDVMAGDMHRRVIRSLTFHTNKTKYGPYGKALGTYFASANKEGNKIVGFHGRSGSYLDAIGVHMQSWVNDDQARQHPPERGGIKNILHKFYK